jgi:hypothetical protein
MQLLTSQQLQEQLGRKYIDESELLPLLLAHGILRHVRTIEVEVQPLGGDAFSVTLDVSKPRVGEAKSEIERVQGTPVGQQDLYKVAVSKDGSAVREDDATPELLDDAQELKGGDALTLAVDDSPVWRTCNEDEVEISQEGTVATRSSPDAADWSLVTSGLELTKSKTHYWEVQLLSEDMNSLCVGVSRPDLDPDEEYIESDCTDGWFISVYRGGLYCNGKQGDDAAGAFTQGDRVGMLLDFADGSLLFFKNGVQHGPGFPAGSVTAPVVHAFQSFYTDDSVRLISDAVLPPTSPKWGQDVGPGTFRNPVVTAAPRAIGSAPRRGAPTRF